MPPKFRRLAGVRKGERGRSFGHPNASVREAVFVRKEVAKAMRSFGCLSKKLVITVGKLVAAVLALALGARIYYVREMVAALIIFSIFFVAVAAVVSVILIIDFASQRLMAWIEVGAAWSARWTIESVRAMLAGWDFGRPVEYFRETRSGIQGLSRLSK